MVEEYNNEYRFSGSLPGNASTYVTRKADNELFDALQKGKFCYVLNSRQSGKSSLRVRTMNRLLEVGVECASIDLSSVSIQSATQENWYADLIVKLIDSFDLDIDFKEWWSENQLNSELLRFGNFLEKKLLAEVKENIVIFIDEIDSVLSLKFPTDDFFAFIRACYNQRPDNPEYNRLTFCLLGVASPSNLIEDKQRTPFNIGKAISLEGFQIDEVEPLERGLQEQFSDFKAVMREILYWTGGQPFLTQKLCQFMVEESESENPRTVERVVRSRIIENWESLDEPEHLRTIRDRILRDVQRAGYLLELYQQVRQAFEHSELQIDDSPEQNELQLSGLVVRQHNKLRVYNPIYREIFDQNWIENQLQNLRPYSENFRFWVASGGTDESRLLRGRALQEALVWAYDKGLSYQDKQYLAASKEKEIQEEIAVKEQEAALERERKNKEAVQQRNQMLSEANKKAQRRSSIGFIVLVVTVLVAATVGLSSRKQVETADEKVKAANYLVEEAQRNLAQAKQKVSKTQQSERQAKNNATQAQKQEQKAKQNEISAQQKVEEAQRNLAQAKQKVSKTQQSERQAKNNAIQAQKQEQKAKQNEISVKQKLKEADKALEKVNQQANFSQEEVKAVQKLNKLAGELENQKSSNSDYNEALRLSALSFNIDNHSLKQAIVFAAQSQADQQKEKLKEAEQEIEKSETNLHIAEADKKTKETDLLQIQVLFYKIKGNFLAQKKKNDQAIEAYSKAFNILKKHPKETDFTKDNQFITDGNITSVHRYLIELLSMNHTKSDLRKQVEQSLTEHLYTQLRYFLNAKNWAEADRQTSRLILNIAKKEYWDDDSIKSFSCPDLQKIDKLWFNSDKRFGFRVQKEIWIRTENRLGVDPPNDFNFTNYLRFAKAVGWYDDKVSENETRDSIEKVVRLRSDEEVIKGIKSNPKMYYGSLPFSSKLSKLYISGGRMKNGEWGEALLWVLNVMEKNDENLAKGGSLFSRVATCKL